MVIFDLSWGQQHRRSCVRVALVSPVGQNINALAFGQCQAPAIERVLIGFTLLLGFWFMPVVATGSQARQRYKPLDETSSSAPWVVRSSELQAFAFFSLQLASYLDTYH